MKRLVVVAAVVLAAVLIGAAVLVTQRSSAPAAGPELPAAEEFAPAGPQCRIAQAMIGRIVKDGGFGVPEGAGVHAMSVLLRSVSANSASVSAACSLCRNAWVC